MAVRARTPRLATLVAALTLLLVLGSAPASQASGVTVQDIESGVTASQLAQALASNDVAISNVSYAGDARAAGSFGSGASSVGFPTGIVLSSGYVQSKGLDDPCTSGVEGPNDCHEDGGAQGTSNSAELGQPGDGDLDALLTEQGLTTEDATVLEFDFVPQQSKVQFNYVFASEEYNDFANSQYNDVFAFFVNGTNCAVVPSTTDLVTINTINNGNPDGDPTPHNAHLFRDNIRPTPGTIDTQMDGLTTVLTCTANVTAGQTSHMKLAIADTSDSALDSAVYLQAGSFVSGEVLTVAKDGTGSGTVASTPAGIDCGATCSAGFANGTQVSLTPTPADGSQFAGWSGACTGTGACQVTMNEAKNVTATFNAMPGLQLTVSKNGTGSGSVSSSPAGIDCGSTCQAVFPEDTEVTLTPTAAAGSQFAGWSGACTGTGACVVTMDAAKSVTATFTALPKHTLTVAKAGNGSGSVAGAPSGISCGATCAADYVQGTQVTLTATPAAGSTFTGWSGACSGTGTCQVTMTEATNVTATFAVVTHNLSVTRAGTGSGSVASSPAGITCGATCSAAYAHGTVVTLTATPAAGSTFTGWSGACSGTGTCQVTMTEARNVTATFGTAVESPGEIPADGLFCGAQNRGKCTGLKVKGVFDRPGNASWTFDAYNTTPGKGKASAAAVKTVRLGKVTRVIKKAGAVSVVFKVSKGASKKLKQVKKLKLKNVLVTLTFKAADGTTSTTTKSIKLKG